MEYAKQADINVQKIYSGSETPNALRGKERDERLSEARILAQVTFLKSNIDSVWSVLRGLEDDLGPIVLPNLDEPVVDPNVPSKPTSFLSSELEDLNGQILDLEKRLVSLRGRIQL